MLFGIDLLQVVVFLVCVLIVSLLIRWAVKKVAGHRLKLERESAAVKEQVAAYRERYPDIQKAWRDPPLPSARNVHRPIPRAAPQPRGVNSMANARSRSDDSPMPDFTPYHRSLVSESDSDRGTMAPAYHGQGGSSGGAGSSHDYGSSHSSSSYSSSSSSDSGSSSGSGGDSD